MIELNKIYNEDCLITMSKMPDEFIDLVITSPPYDNLRTYKGYSFDFEKIAKELYRIIKPGGVVVWVVADASIDGSETGTSFRQALYFKDVCGFNLHDTMIYRKENPKPTTNFMHKRYEQAFEYMFVLSRGKPKTFNPITVEKTYKVHRTKVFSARQPDGSMKEGKYSSDKTYKIKENVWSYTVGYLSSTCDDVAFEHPAIFPEQLVADHMHSWSNEGDIVYDPFMGSGTVAKVSILMRRNYIGSEIAKEYCEIAEKRISLYKENIFAINQ